MGLTQPRSIFGIHSFAAVNKTTGLPYGKPIKVLGSANLNHTADLIELQGGSNPNAVAVERGIVTNEISLTIKEYPTWIMEIAGHNVTTNAAEATGATEGFANKVGTSVFEASTGIATATVKSGSEADLKTGTYIVKAVTTTTVDVYAVTDVSFLRGTDLEFVDDTMKITSSPLTITASSAVEIPNLGVELTGGSGVIGMTADDVAIFDVREPNAGSTVTSIGEQPIPVEFEGYFAFQKKSNGDIAQLIAYRAIMADFPIGGTENEFSTTDITIKLLYDTTASKVYDIKDLIGV